MRKILKKLDGSEEIIEGTPEELAEYEKIFGVQLEEVKKTSTPCRILHD